jgi:hypothetical protein
MPMNLNLDSTVVLVNVGYLLMLMGFIARDVLWLRCFLVLGQTSVVIYSVHKGALPVAAWNGLFALINLGYVVHILRERRKISLPADLRDLYATVFAAFTPVEFQHLWKQGTLKKIESGVLIREGEMQQELICLLTGQVRVERQGHTLARLGRGRFLAEMSFLNNEPSSAKVLADTPVEYIAWNIGRLRRWQREQPARWIKLQSVLGHDLIEKLKHGSHSQRSRTLSSPS